MSEAAEFIDAALQYEASPYSGSDAPDDRLAHYGASIGAIRGTVRDGLRRYPGMTHDQITALSSELWAAPVFERRRAAIVLLQSSSTLLGRTDLTRIEGFVRSAQSSALVDALVAEVLRPLIDGLADRDRARADAVIARWSSDSDAELARAAALVDPRAMRQDVTS